MKKGSDGGGINDRHNAFALLLIEGLSQAEAYRRVYPKSMKWTPEAVQVEASRLAATPKVSLRVAELRQKAVDAAVMGLNEYLRTLTTCAREAAKGLKPFLKQVTPDGDLSFDINEQNVTQAIESIEQHIQVAKEGSGRDDTVIRKIKVRDCLPYLHELAEAMGWHKKAPPPEPPKLPEEINIFLKMCVEQDWKPRPRKEVWAELKAGK